MNRLYPKISSGRWFVLTKLRRVLEGVCTSYFSLKGGAIILDYGSGSSPYKPLFKPYVSTYKCADLEGNGLADITLLPEGELPLEDETVDVVLSTQVLEHVKRPDQYIKEARRVTKNDGLLILTTHGRWMYHPDPQDYWRWTTEGLAVLLDDCGWKIESLHPVMGLSATGVQFVQDGISPRIPSFIRPLFFGLVVIAQLVLERLDTKRSDASVFVVIARKKMEV